MTVAALPGRRVTRSVEELLAGATAREQLPGDDGKSGAVLERVTIAGEHYVLKRLGTDRDWVARATGDLGCRPRLLWQAGVLDRLPACLDHAIVACADDPPRGAALLLRDVGAYLVPEGDAALPLDQHRRFLAHMAALHTAFWDSEDLEHLGGPAGLLPLATRYTVLSPLTVEAEDAYGGTHEVPRRLLPDGWRRLPRAARRAGPVALELVRDPGPLVAALSTTPATLVHGDWKAGNLGSAPDGRTILLDWAIPGRAPGCADLAWYLAINAARLPESKEEAIDAYHRALRGGGVDTGAWWDKQLGLCLIGAFLQLGWEKTFGDPAELGWWEERVMEAIRWLP